jgi:superfamily II DNA helicase RecQ
MPTGSGKSLLYMLHSLERNMCVILFCPFVLLCSQVCSNKSCENLSIVNWKDITTTNIDHHVSTAHIVVCPFEAASMNSRLVGFAERLHDRYRLGNIVVDEAHVLVHDQNYRTFAGFWTFIPHLKRVLHGQVCVVAMTATLRPKHEAILATQLGLTSPQPEQVRWSVFRKPSFRQLRVRLQKFRTKEAALHELIVLLNACLTNSTSSCAIVFCMTIEEVEELGSDLPEMVPECVINHSKLDQLQNFQVFKQTRIMVSTSSAGAGLDIADLDHVILWRSFWTVEQCVQIGGRTGRHGPGSLTLLQFNDHSYSTSKDVDIATLIE